MPAEARILFLRGVNVGGHGRLPMAGLRDLLAELGCEGAATHIQSGNAVFRAPGPAGALAERVAAAIEARFGFRPEALVLDRAALARALAETPFEGDEGRIHLGFLARPPRAGAAAALAALAQNGEALHLTEAVFYLSAPEGIGRSKLAARAEQALGVPMTMRNLRVARAVARLADEL